MGTLTNTSSQAPFLSVDGGWTQSEISHIFADILSYGTISSSRWWTQNELRDTFVDILCLSSLLLVYIGFCFGWRFCVCVCVVFFVLSFDFFVLFKETERTSSHIDKRLRRTCKGLGDWET